MSDLARRVEEHLERRYGRLSPELQALYDLVRDQAMRIRDLEARCSMMGAPLVLHPRRAKGGQA